MVGKIHARAGGVKFPSRPLWYQRFLLKTRVLYVNKMYFRSLSFVLSEFSFIQRRNKTKTTAGRQFVCRCFRSQRSEGKIQRRYAKASKVPPQVSSAV